MQRATVDYVHTRHSPDERVGPREAAYLRDEVSGPLSGSGISTTTATTHEVNQGKKVKKKTVHEEVTEVVEEDRVEPTPSEANVSRDFGLLNHVLYLILTPHL